MNEVVRKFPQQDREERSYGMERTRVLITGATGLIGRAVAKRLVSEAYTVRALARRTSDLSALRDLRAEVVFGDLADAQSIVSAVQNVDVVVHAAAGTSGTRSDSEIATVQGTRHVLEACREAGIKKLIYISTCNVYEVASRTPHDVLGEESLLERHPERRGRYTNAKLKAEKLIVDAMRNATFGITVLRPGTVYGPESEVYTKMMGVTFSKRVFLVFGSGATRLPLVHVDNVVDAIAGCIVSSAADNQIFNVVDSQVVSKRMLMNQAVKRIYPGSVVLYVPMPLLIALTWLQEKLMDILGRQPFLTVYRLMSSQRGVHYDASKLEQAIGWRSRVDFEQGVQTLISAHHLDSQEQERSISP